MSTPTRRVVLKGPTVLAGHSYGGAVISGAAAGVENVVGLVFASAFAPDEGESLGELGSRFAPPPGLAIPSPTRWAFCGSIGGGPDQLRPGDPGGMRLRLALARRTVEHPGVDKARD